ncbi:MAG: MOSC domain-containing protein [Sulfurovaceae bacterium]|nr:MOSC domain-containing protein [Sulfurovaceae bacterium]
MHKVGKILKLFISIKGLEKRVEKEQLNVDENGILEDKFYGKDRQRSILLSSKDSYLLTEANGITLEYGELGENILMDFNPYSLTIGTELQIGEVVLEITQACTICNHLSKIDKKLPKLLKEERGIFAKVIKKGSIYKNDAIFML